jgi:hypothetical protein
VSTAEEQAPFQRLIKLIERELELAGQGRIEELNDAVEQTGLYMANLPVPAPSSAQALVLRAEALRGRVTIETKRLGESIVHSRTSLQRARRISRRYGIPGRNRISTSA